MFVASGLGENPGSSFPGRSGVHARMRVEPPDPKKETPPSAATLAGQSVVAIIPLCANPNGRPEVLGRAIGASRVEPVWTEFLRRPIGRRPRPAYDCGGIQGGEMLIPASFRVSTTSR